MARSMTGFGKAAAEFDGQFVTIELSSVNHRFLDCSLRIPNSWAPLDPALKRIVSDHLSRGKVSINVNRRKTHHNAANVNFDIDIARQYVEASRELSHLLGTFENLSLDTLAQLEGVIYQEEQEDNLEAILPHLERTLVEALGHLNGMRETEGRALAADLSQRLDGLRAQLAAVEAQLPEIQRLYQERLRTRVLELSQDTAVTEERLAVEMAIMADKSDVTEEVVRLKAHYDHMNEMLNSAEPIGRKLDFLMQEIQREMNTLGVKVRDAGVAHMVLNMKAELEKIREQAHNIE